jgi:flagellar basal-body rod modification protein FlgD
MSSVNPVNGSSGSAADTTGTTAASPQKTLTTQDFLQMLATQLQNQDPLQPMDDSAYLAQMAQFTSLQQVSTLSDQVTSMRSDQQKFAAANYLGRNVTMNTGNNTTVTGEVTAVDTSGDTPNLQVNGTCYPLTSLLSVSAPPVTSTSTANATN